MFVMDASGSLEPTFDMAQKLARKIINGFNFNGGRTRVGVVLFAENQAQQFQLKDYLTKREVLSALAFDLIGML